MLKVEKERQSKVKELLIFASSSSGEDVGVLRDLGTSGFRTGGSRLIRPNTIWIPSQFKVLWIQHKVKRVFWGAGLWSLGQTSPTAIWDPSESIPFPKFQAAGPPKSTTRYNYPCPVSGCLSSWCLSCIHCILTDKFGNDKQNWVKPHPAYGRFPLKNCWNVLFSIKILFLMLLSHLWSVSISTKVWKANKHRMSFILSIPWAFRSPKKPFRVFQSRLTTAKMQYLASCLSVQLCFLVTGTFPFWRPVLFLFPNHFELRQLILFRLCLVSWFRVSHAAPSASSPHLEAKEFWERTN